MRRITNSKVRTLDVSTDDDSLIIRESVAYMSDGYLRRRWAKQAISVGLAELKKIVALAEEGKL